MFEPLQLKVDEIMKDKEYNSVNWSTNKFEGEDYSEKAWQKRLHKLLEFLLGKFL